MAAPEGGAFCREARDALHKCAQQIDVNRRGQVVVGIWWHKCGGTFVVGGTYTAGNHFKTKLATSKTSIEYNSDYIEFTIAADAGYILNLISLNFDSARGGSSYIISVSYPRLFNSMVIEGSTT